VEHVTLAKDCEELVGSHGLVSLSLAFSDPGGIANSNPDGSADALRVEVQEDMFNIVTTGDDRLTEPVGRLVASWMTRPPTGATSA